MFRNHPGSFARRIVVAAAVLVLGASFSSAAFASATCVGDFERGDFSEWDAVHALPGDVAVVDRPVRNGRYAGRFQVTETSVPFPNLQSNRADVMERTYEAAGQESWWAWSTYFDRDFMPNVGSSWNAFTVWHHEQSLYVQPISFEVDASVSPWKLKLHAWGGPPSMSPIYQRNWHLANFEREKWYDFVFHVKWGDTPDTGFVELWLNGEVVVPLTPAATLYSGDGVYVKQGFYRNKSAYTAVVYHDGLRRGSSFADLQGPCVAPAGDVSPPPMAAPPTEPLSPTAAPATGLSIELVRRPAVHWGERLGVVAKTLPQSSVGVVVRSVGGRLLGSTRTRAGARGFVWARLKLPRYRGERRLRITIRTARDGLQSERIVGMVLSRRERQLLAIR